MILEAKFINRPNSGDYSERIYDNDSPWNSQDWSWVKFTNEDYTEWCGCFRGSPRETAVSQQRETALILTSNYLFQLNSKNGDVLQLLNHMQYISLTTTPDGNFLIADCYNIFKITTSINELKEIPYNLGIDSIKFKGWNNNKLKIECQEFCSWERHLVLDFDYLTEKFEIVSDKTIKEEIVTTKTAEQENIFNKIKRNISAGLKKVGLCAFK